MGLYIVYLTAVVTTWKHCKHGYQMLFDHLTSMYVCMCMLSKPFMLLYPVNRIGSSNQNHWSYTMYLLALIGKINLNTEDSLLIYVRYIDFILFYLLGKTLNGSHFHIPRFNK